MKNNYIIGAFIALVSTVYIPEIKPETFKLTSSYTTAQKILAVTVGVGAVVSSALITVPLIRQSSNELGITHPVTLGAISLQMVFVGAIALSFMAYQNARPFLTIVRTHFTAKEGNE